MILSRSVAKVLHDDGKSCRCNDGGSAGMHNAEAPRVQCIQRARHARGSDTGRQHPASSEALGDLKDVSTGTQPRAGGKKKNKGKSNLNVVKLQIIDSKSTYRSSSWFIYNPEHFQSRNLTSSSRNSTSHRNITGCI